MSEAVDLVGIAQKFYSLCADGNFAALDSIITDDFRVREAEDLPFPGTFTGIDGLQALFVEVMGSLSIIDMRQTSFLAGDQIVCAMVELVSGQDPDYTIEVAEIFRFRDGQIFEIQPFWFDAGSLARLKQA